MAGRNDVEVTVAAYNDALAEGRTTEACALLSVPVREELESSTGIACEQSVTEEVAAESGPWRIEVYGDQALARTGGRATFLARFDDGWQVTATGCTEKGVGDLFDCTLEGG
jgi:hypothetical protein